MNRLLTVLGVLLLFAQSAHAEKSLGWNALKVRAHLDGAGLLHVVERHDMVLSGDWNGGERIFRVEPSQVLEVEGMTRIAADGTQHPMEDGDLSLVDRWSLEKKHLRWRSRLPSDPEFNQTPLSYEIRYALAKILVPAGGEQFRIAHDFAFPDRDAAIAAFDLDLSFAPEWNAAPIHASVRDLAPGKSHVVMATLRYSGQGAPSAAPRYLRWLRWIRPAFVIAPSALLLALFFFGRQSRRRKIATDDRKIDRSWLEANLFVYPPEVAGALLDGEVGPNAVAAMLASMERAGRIQTAATRGKKPDLTLRLLVDKDELPERERALADLFFESGTEVNTKELRQSRKSTGFDPPGTIRGSVESETERIAPGAIAGVRIQRIAFLFLAGVLSLAAGITMRTVELVLIFVVILGGLAVLTAGFRLAARWKESPGAAAGLMLLVPAAGFTLAVLLIEPLVKSPDDVVVQFTLFGLAGLGFFLAAFYQIILDAAKETLSAEAIALRTHMTRARDWFRKELSRPEPEIDDAWMPWIIALGLNQSVSSWWKTHRGGRVSSAAGETSASGDSSWSAGTASSPGSATSFTGGDGRFGGAGATGSWGAAATAFAAPISAPSQSSSSSSSSGSSSSSSSSSSSDSSSDSSSGGGGGGGW